MLGTVEMNCTFSMASDGLDLGRGVDADRLSGLGTRIDPGVIAGDRVV